MIPVLFEIGPLKIYSYGFMLVVAFFTDYYLLTKDLKRRNLDAEFAGDVVMWAAIGGILGSKIYYLIENYKAVMADPFGMIFSGAGLVFLGGLMGGMLAVTLLVRKKGYGWLMFADIVAPLLILGYAIGRVGCLLVGDDYGIPTNLPWGMTFPNGIPQTILPVHPTQIYEIILGGIIFTVLWKLRKWSRPDGSLFFLYLILAGAERFFIEFIRTNSRYLFGLTGAQIISILMIGVGTFFILRFRNNTNEESTSPT